MMPDINLPEHNDSPAVKNPAGNPLEGTSKAPERVKQSEIVEGGSPKLEIWLDPTTQKLATERLINRLQTVNAISSKELPLTTIDRLVQKLEPETIARLEKGDLTREDLAIAVFVLRDELLQKSLAAGKRIKDNKIVEGKKVGIRGFRKTVENSRLQTQLEASTQQLSTEYTREIGFDQWTQDRIENDLVALNQLRTNVELSFYGRRLDDPLFDQDSISLYTAGRKTGNRLHDAIVDELMGTEGVLTQRFAGKTYLELSQEDPIAATQALFEANQRALTQFAGETAKELLKAEKPKTDSNIIKSQADKLRQEPKPEEIAPLTNEKIKTTHAKLDAVNNELDEVKKEIEELETSQEYKTGELSEEANKRLEFLENRKNEVLKNQLLTKADLEFFQLDLNQSLESHNTPEARIERQEKTKALSEWVNVLSGYDIVIDARLSQTHGDEYTRERLSNTKERSDGTIEGAERIREHIFRLINKGDYGPELARKMLSDEAIARAIIWVYRLDATTKLDIGTPHETTLSSLLEYLGDNRDLVKIIETIKPSDRRDSEREDLKNFKDIEKRLIKAVLPYLNSSQFQTGDLLRFMIHEGLKQAEIGNPYLSLSEYYESPKPELRLEAKSIYREGVGKAKEENNEQGEKGLAWGASVPKPVKLPGFERNDLPLYFSFPFIFDKTKGSILYKTYIKMDERFMQSLPRALDASLPSEIKEKLYDATTGLLHSEKIKRNDFIQIQDSTFDEENRIIKLLDYLKNNVSEDAPKMLKVSIANYFLERNPVERLASLKGLGGQGIPMEIEGVTTTVKNPDGGWDTVTKDYQIDFDNTGNFFLVDLTTNERHELQSFYKIELENFRESKGIQTLSQTDRKALNDQSFAKIQERLGEAILYAQSV